MLGDSDAHNPSFVIAQYYNNALAMPDRDYYLKDDARFKEAREKYLAYMQRLFTLAGSNQAQAKTAADTVLRLEKQYANVSLDNVALRDPQQTDHKMTFAELQKLAPAFDWKGYYAATGLGQGDLNVNEPKLVQEFARQLRETSLADWQTYLRSRVLDAAAPALSSDFVKAEFAFRGQFLNGAREMKPRWKRCVESTDALLGEALGRKYVEKYFPPEAKARMQELVKNLRLAMKETIEGSRLDEPADQGACAGEARHVQSQDRLSGQVEGLQQGRRAARRLLGIRAGGAEVRRAGRSRADQQADRSRPLGPDAADFRRVLQPDAERDRLSGRHPAAAGLQHEGGRRRQLRRDRRGDRS